MAWKKQYGGGKWTGRSRRVRSGEERYDLNKDGWLSPSEFDLMRKAQRAVQELFRSGHGESKRRLLELLRLGRRR